MAPTFRKQERIVSHQLIETLFEKGDSQSLAAYPLRAVFLQTERKQGHAPIQILISVPKKRFKHAVDRNRIKRLIREAYRLNKQLLLDAPSMQGKSLDLAFIWISDELSDFCTIESRVKNLLQRISENLEA